MDRCRAFGMLETFFRVRDDGLDRVSIVNDCTLFGHKELLKINGFCMLDSLVRIITGVSARAMHLGAFQLPVSTITFKQGR